MLAHADTHAEGENHHKKEKIGYRSTRYPVRWTFEVSLDIVLPFFRPFGFVADIHQSKFKVFILSDPMPFRIKQ